MRGQLIQSRRCGARGSALIITVLLLVIVGLTAAAAMKGAVSSEQVANNLRQEALAQQYAEMGLNYCEFQLGLPSSSRPLTLQDAALKTTDLTPSNATVDTGNWNQASTWTPSTVTPVPGNWVGDATSSSFTPARLPECFAENLLLANGGSAFLITARGFSPGYRSDASTGGTLAGSVVWLQSVVTFK